MNSDKKISISIVIPAYNAEKYVRETLDSVVRQTYEDWELIVVDDGSTDNTWKICENYAQNINKKHGEKMKVIHHEKNLGQMVARRSGIDIAQGEYLVLQAADDTFTDDALERIYNAFVTSGCDMIMFGYTEFGDSFDTWVPPWETGTVISKNDMLEWVIRTTSHSDSAKSVRLNLMKSAMQETLMDRLSLNGDYALIIPLLCKIRNCYVLSETLINYRIHKQSISHSITLNHITDTQKVSAFVVEYLKKCKMLSSKIERAIYISHLHMILPRIEQLFYEKRITNEECNRIYCDEIYKKSKMYETEEILGKSSFRFARMFRKKQFFRIRIMLFLVYIKKNVIIKS